MNIFKRYPEFIEDDVRKNRKDEIYNINFDFLKKRYSSLLPPDMIKDKTILDLGAAIGSLGAWCLHWGAKHYTGVDHNYSNIANKNLSKYFDSSRWKWVEMDVEEYLNMWGNIYEYDFAVLAGIIYYFEDHSTILKKVKAKTIIIETNSAEYTQWRIVKHESEEKWKPRKFEPKSYYDKILQDYEYKEFVNHLPEFYNDGYRTIYHYKKK